MPNSNANNTELVKSSGDVFDMIEGTIDAHAIWLEKWHRAIICQSPLDEKLLSDEPHLESRFDRWFGANIDKKFLDRAAFGELGKLHEQMHRVARDLALKSAKGRSIEPKEYDDFIGLVTSFSQTISRVRQGLRQAATESDPVTGLSNREAMLNKLENEPLHVAFLEQPFVLSDGKSFPVTASFGVNMLDTEVPIHESIERVDDAVITAKCAGRNRCMMWSPELAN